MSDATPAEVQRLIADAFDRQGWEYDLTVGRRLVAEIERTGGVDAETLAARLPGEFIERNRTTRANVAAAIERAVGGRSVAREPASTTVVINDNRYQVNVSGSAQIQNSKLNVGEGTQINVDVNASKDDVLAAIEVLLRAGLAEGWNNDAARDLAAVIDERADITVDDVRELTAEVLKAEQPKQGRVKELLNDIAVSGLGGVFSAGIVSGLGQLIAQLPL